MDFAKTPERWDETADVIIIGSGLTGLAAAAEASKSGRVIVLDKMSYYGGNSVLAGGGYACWDSKLKLRQKLDLGEDSETLHMEDTLKGGGYYNIPELAKVMAQGAPSGLDWLVDAGVKFKDVLVRVGGHSASRGYQCATSGKVMMDCVKEFVLDAGAEIWLNSKVTKIFRDTASGEVIGLEVEKQTNIIKIHAHKAVIIASGGFGRDIELRMELRMEHNPVLTDSLTCSNHKGATGEVIRYAKAIGADTLHMEFVQLYPCANPSTGSVDRWAFYAYSGTGFGMIYVDDKGKRFVSELAGRDEVSKAQINLCKKPTWAIFNDEIVAALGMTSDEEKTGIRLGRIVKGGSVEELEAKLSMPKGGLTGTVRQINHALTNDGIDPDFGGERGKGMASLERGPFFAISQWPSVHYTMGGLRIDETARVIDVFGKPIPRLYAAGEVCGGVHGANRLGGNSLAECVVFGRIAGKQAAAEKAR